MERLLCLLLLALWGLTTSVHAKPLAFNDVPEPLKAWVDWALQGSESSDCPFLYDQPNAHRCAWPTRLELNVDEQQGSFRMIWEVQIETHVTLPGNGDYWPQDVAVDNRPAVVSGILDDTPGTWLPKGSHTVTGHLYWDRLPENLPIPRETGLISLTVKGQAMSQAIFNAQGQLWIEGAMRAGGEGAKIANRLDLQVYRRIIDQTPLRVVSWLNLDVSGEQREILLDGALLKDFIPVSIDSPLPARLESDGRLRLQIRPGHWVVQIDARSPRELVELVLPGSPAPWPSEEIWVYEAHREVRTAEIEGVPSVDPQQTTLPDIWKALPAYHLQSGQTMHFQVVRKGDPEPEPDALNLRRTIWLDFAGTGYTLNDEINGSMTHEWRLNMAPTIALGRVALDGMAQPITRLDPEHGAGVEVRRGRVRLSADSRYESGIASMPAVGWDKDFRSVSARLNLPPGWKLLAATGVDNAPETWVGRWTLLDLFMVLIGALAVAQLWGWPSGLLALAALTLLWHEPGAPRSVWLNLLAAIALLRVLPDGRFTRFVTLYRNLGFAALLLISLPFMVDQVRLGIYPQLEKSWPTLLPTQPFAPAPQSAVSDEAGLPEASMSVEQPVADYMPQAAKRMMSLARPSSSALQGGSAGYTAARFREIDPHAITQTGPGLPRWSWNSVNLSWNGPVMRSQTLGLVLLSPALNLVLNLLRLALLIGLAWVLLGQKRGPGGKPLGKLGSSASQPVQPVGKTDSLSLRLSGGSFPVMSLALLVLTLLSVPAKADYPPEDLLRELKSRLLEAPECLPRCVDIPKLEIKLAAGTMQQRLEIHAEQALAIPLPAQENQWLPGSVMVDGTPATALLRSGDGQLWLALQPGRHEVTLAGPMPQRQEVIVPLPLAPHRVTVEGSGWAIQGIGDNGVPAAQLQLSRERPADQQPVNHLEARPLPVFLEISRTLQLGLDWHVETAVHRESPADVPATIEVPLLEGESVTTAGLAVHDGKVLISLPAGEAELTWASVLEKRPEIHLQAPDTQAWTEIWRVDVSPIWHLQTSGIAPVHHQDGEGNWLPEWRPWPGESIDLTLTKPEGIAGASLTIDSSQLRTSPGQRATDTTLILSLRSTQGGQHTITLPVGAVLQSARINGQTQPLRQQGTAVSLPVHPGEQTFQLEWREDAGISSHFGLHPVDLGVASVNTSQTIQLGQDRWVLLAGGPRLGPAVLFWGVLVVLLALSLALGRWSRTPLQSAHWLLLLIGLSQLDIGGAGLVVTWLLALGWRGREGAKLERKGFNALQAALGLLTLAALGLLFAAVEQGLLGLPDMQVAGNQSTATMLNWYQDRSPAALPAPWVITAPLWAYRVLMLLWALWLAYSLLQWLRWGWACCGTGGLWRSGKQAAKSN